MDEQKQMVFREVTLAVCSTLDIEEGLFAALSSLRRFMPIDMLYLAVFDGALESVRLVAHVTPRGITSLPADRVVGLSKDGARFIESRIPGKSYRYNDVRQAPPMLSASKLLGIQGLFSAMNMRVAVGEEMIGTVGLAASGLNQYRREHEALLEEVQKPIAIALINSLRYHETERLRSLLAEENEALQDDLNRLVGYEIVGEHGGLAGVMEAVRRVARQKSPVLLTGETGTGKELVARAIHENSPRRDKPLIAVNCGAISENLIESELFGHEKGAFTGADSIKRGRFERADGGTLFLDEIGELPLSAQVELLRVLQTFEFERVGGSKTLRVDVRVIAATHRDLRAMVREGSFREDLWYRLDVFPLEIPPLCERPEDIPSLVRHFIHRKAQEMNFTVVPRIASGEMSKLKSYRWPGNVRELQNVVERALIVNRGSLLRFPQLDSRECGPSTVGSGDDIDSGLSSLDVVIREHCRRVLAVTKGRIEGAGGAAEILEIQPNTLRARLRKLGLTYGRNWIHSA